MRGKVAREYRKKSGFHPKNSQREYENSRGISNEIIATVKNSSATPRAIYKKMKKNHRGLSCLK